MKSYKKILISFFFLQTIRCLSVLKWCSSKIKRNIRIKSIFPEKVHCGPFYVLLWKSLVLCLCVFFIYFKFIWQFFSPKMDWKLNEMLFEFFGLINRGCLKGFLFFLGFEILNWRKLHFLVAFWLIWLAIWYPLPAISWNKLQPLCAILEVKILNKLV